MNKKNLLLITGIVSLISLGGCSSKTDYSLNPTMPRMVASYNAEESKEAQLTANKTAYYFNLDESKTNDQKLATLKLHANKIIKSNSSITITGHADERGSSEYNYELGKKRAEFIASQLVALGVPKDNIKIASYGKDKPLAAGHDEKSWKVNRRVEVNYTA